MPKDITFGTEARTRILQGVLKAVRAIAVTYGPMGRTVMLQRMAGLLSTKDGVSVAQELILENPLENLGCQILKNACITVNDNVGDGTTSVALITASILQESYKHTIAGIDPNLLIQSFKDTEKTVLECLENLSVPVKTQTDLENVALISCNGDQEIAKLMAEACMAAGKNGTILIEDGYHVESKLEFKEGLELDIRPISNTFLKGSTEKVFNAPLVAVVNFPFRRFESIRSLLEIAGQWPDNPLIIFARDIDGDAFRTIVINDSKNVINLCAFNAPKFNDPEEFLKDIAAVAGAYVVNPIAGDNLDEWKSEWFGSFRQIIVKPNRSVITSYPDKQNFTQNRIKELQIARDRCTSDYDKDQIVKRIAKLSEGMVILKIGGITESSRKERRSRVEDALLSVKASLKHGVVPGGGRAYQLMAEVVEDSILKKAFLIPMSIHTKNRNLSVASIIEKLPKDPWVGWDVMSNQIRNLQDNPMIVDPTLIVETVIRTAISTASLLLMADTGITRI